MDSVLFKFAFLVQVRPWLLLACHVKKHSCNRISRFLFANCKALLVELGVMVCWKRTQYLIRISWFHYSYVSCLDWKQLSLLAHLFAQIDAQFFVLLFLELNSSGFFFELLDHDSKLFFCLNLIEILGNRLEWLSSHWVQSGQLHCWHHRQRYSLSLAVVHLSVPVVKLIHARLCRKNLSSC